MRWPLLFLLPAFCLVFFSFSPSRAWFDETHVAVAKVAGYSKWFNAVGPDMIKEKMGNRGGHHHFVCDFGTQLHTLHYRFTPSIAHAKFYLTPPTWRAFSATLIPNSSPHRHATLLAPHSTTTAPYASTPPGSPYPPHSLRLPFESIPPPLRFNQSCRNCLSFTFPRKLSTKYPCRIDSVLPFPTPTGFRNLCQK